MNGYTHLSHSFIINAFSLKTARDRLIFNNSIIHNTPPVYKGRILKVSIATGSASRNAFQQRIVRRQPVP